MKFNLFMTIRGPGGLAEVPNNTNPIEAENINEVLKRIGKIPTNLFGVDVEILQIRIKKVEE
jgi:hypothetical protein